MKTTPHTPDMDAATAYRKGWEASKRTRTGDMENGSIRFARKHGTLLAAYWGVGWVDQETGVEYGENLEGEK